MSFVKGDRFRHATKPEWQIGEVFDVSSSGKLHMYFVGAGRKCLDPTLINLIKVAGDDAQSVILDTLHDPTWPFARFSIYVIELNECAWNETSFRRENPNRDPSKPCLYVGMSWHSPEVRFSQHMGGEHPGRYAFRYREGARLRSDLFRAFNPMHKRLAQLMEIERAVQLRNEGFAVWQR